MEDSMSTGRLSYSTNGAGVYLRTSLGEVEFLSDEFNHYRNLFKMLDTTNGGAISVSKSLWVLLQRTGLSHDLLSQIISLVVIEGHEQQQQQQQQQASSPPSSSSLHSPSMHSPGPGGGGRVSAAAVAEVENGVIGEGESPSASAAPNVVAAAAVVATGQLSFHAWLLLCKTIAFMQHLKKESAGERTGGGEEGEGGGGGALVEPRIDEKTMETLHIVGIKTRADFALRRVLPQLVHYLRDEFAISVTGSEICGEGYEQHHIKYRISVTTTTTGRMPSGSSSSGSGASHGGGDHARKPRSNSEGGGSSGERFAAKAEVTRRYSDFEFFANTLRNSYGGSIVPPLPPKSWAFNSVSPEMTEKRIRELSLFLQRIVQHELLKHTYELKVFLDACSSGYKAFREIYAEPALSLTGIQSNLYSAVTSGASMVTKSKAFTAVTSFWGEIGKRVLPTSVLGMVSSSSTPSSSSKEDGAKASSSSTSSSYAKPLTILDQNVDRLDRILDSIATASEKMENILAIDRLAMLELSQLGYHMKAITAVGEDPGLDLRLLQTAESVEELFAKHQKALDAQDRQILTPFQYLGRYHDSLRMAVEQRKKIISNIESLHASECSLKRALDTARSTAGSSEATIHKASSELKAAEAALEAARSEERQSSALLQADQQKLTIEQSEEVRLRVLSFLSAKAQECAESTVVWESLRETLLSKEPFAGGGGSLESSSYSTAGDFLGGGN